MPQPEAGEPRVSVIVPARNEERNLGQCLRTLLAQGEETEILVADDGSQDATAEIARQFAASCPRVKLVSVAPLPEGWVGKNHAAHLGVQGATGAWLLFTDADTRHQPGVAIRLAQWAEKAGLDLVSLSPQQEVVTWWEKAVIPLLYRLLDRMYPYERVNDPKDPTAAANGQFLLLRREAYFAVGGHAAVKGEVLEDVALARRLKQAGYRIWFGPGDGMVCARMYDRFREMWQGWTKNLFLLYHRDSGRLRRDAAALAFRYVLPVLAGALLFPWGWWGAGAGLALWLYVAGEHYRYWKQGKGGGRAGGVVWLVPGALLLFLLLLNSERRYRRHGGIVWKGRRYQVAPGASSRR